MYRSMLDSTYNHILAKLADSQFTEKMIEVYFSNRDTLSMQIDCFIKAETKKSFELKNYLLPDFELYQQMFIIMAIAYMGQHDLKSPNIKMCVYYCLLGKETGNVGLELQSIKEQYPEVIWSKTIWRLEKLLKKKEIINRFFILRAVNPLLFYRETINCANNAKQIFL